MKVGSIVDTRLLPSTLTLVVIAVVILVNNCEIAPLTSIPSPFKVSVIMDAKAVFISTILVLTADMIESIHLLIDVSEVELLSSIPWLYPVTVSLPKSIIVCDGDPKFKAPS